MAPAVYLAALSSDGESGPMTSWFWPMADNSLTTFQAIPDQVRGSSARPGVAHTASFMGCILPQRWDERDTRNAFEINTRGDAELSS